MTIPPSSGPVAFRLRRPYDDAEAFVAGDGPAITRSGMVLVGAGPRPVGLIVRFEIALRDGTALFRGEGRVVGHRATAAELPAGLELRFTRLDARGKALVDQIVVQRGEKPDGSLPPPSRTSVSLSPASLPPLSLRSAAPRPSQGPPSGAAPPVIPDLRVPSLPPDLLADVLESPPDTDRSAQPHPPPLSSSVERGAPAGGEPTGVEPSAASPAATRVATPPESTPTATSSESTFLAASPGGTSASPEDTPASPEDTPASVEGTSASPEGTSASPEGTSASLASGSTPAEGPLPGSVQGPPPAGAPKTRAAGPSALPLSTELERGPGGEGSARPGGEGSARSGGEADRDALLARLRGRAARDRTGAPGDRDALLARLRGRSYGRRRRESRGERGRRAR